MLAVEVLPPAQRIWSVLWECLFGYIARNTTVLHSHVGSTPMLALRSCHLNGGSAGGLNPAKHQMYAGL
jgi:hypothetical protein